MRTISYYVSVAGCTLSACLLFSDVTQAYPYIPLTQEQSIEQLAEHIQQKIHADPANYYWPYTLARLYGEAYANRVLSAPSPSSDAESKIDPGLPYFYPYWEPWRPERWMRSSDTEAVARGEQAATEEQARKFLSRMIQAYQDALRLNPGSLCSQMGLAWGYAENGQREKAIAMYHQAHALAWEKESSPSYQGLEGESCEVPVTSDHVMSLTVESGKALLRLLPRGVVNNKERSEIEEHMKAIQDSNVHNER